MSRLPNFFVIGAPKAGTTSLYHYLGQHPQIYMSPIKEPCFFAPEIRAENCDPDLRRHMTRVSSSLREFLDGPMIETRFDGIVEHRDDYLCLFRNASSEIAVGEASVCYLWSAEAAGAIAREIPDARIVVMLRDPAERAFSQYLHGAANGAIRWSFREHIERNLSHKSGRLCIHYPFLEFGLYSRQLTRYTARFQKVWIGFHEDFKASPLHLIRSLFEFLGVDPDFAPDLSRRYLEARQPRSAAIGRLKRSRLWRSAANAAPSAVRPLFRRLLLQGPGAVRIEAADRRFLIDFYRDDIGKLAALLNRSLDAWLRP